MGTLASRHCDILDGHLVVNQSTGTESLVFQIKYPKIVKSEGNRLGLMIYYKCTKPAGGLAGSLSDVFT